MMPAVRIIPERTIDAWTSSAVLDREPRALVWAPTPPAQARSGCQPWHFPIGAFDLPGKLLVLQNKALIARPDPHCFPKVSVDLAQLARLVDLEVDGLPVFYGLPGLCDVDLPSSLSQEDLSARALLRLHPGFDRWQRLVRPLELLALTPVMKAIVANRRVMTLNTLGSGPLPASEGIPLGYAGRSLGQRPADRSGQSGAAAAPAVQARSDRQRRGSAGRLHGASQPFRPETTPT